MHHDTSTIMIIIGLILIIAEFVFGGATVFFLAITGIIFILSGFALGAINEPNFILLITIFSIISLAIVYSLFVWSKNNKKTPQKNLDDNCFVDEVFVLNQPIEANGKPIQYRIFGLDWLIVNGGSVDLKEETLVKITKVEVGKLTVTKK